MSDKWPVLSFHVPVGVTRDHRAIILPVRRQGNPRNPRNDCFPPTAHRHHRQWPGMGPRSGISPLVFGIFRERALSQKGGLRQRSGEGHFSGGPGSWRVAAEVLLPAAFLLAMALLGSNFSSCFALFSALCSFAT